MELCYAGDLVMPSSYAMMDEDEMTYVEGGGKLTITLSNNLVRGCAAAFAGGGVAGVILKVGVILGTKAGAFGAAISLATAGVGTWVAVALVGAVSSMAAFIGGYIAQRLANHIWPNGVKITPLVAWYIPGNIPLTL